MPSCQMVRCTDSGKGTVATCCNCAMPQLLRYNFISKKAAPVLPTRDYIGSWWFMYSGLYDSTNLSKVMQPQKGCYCYLSSNQAVYKFDTSLWQGTSVDRIWWVPLIWSWPGKLQFYFLQIVRPRYCISWPGWNPMVVSIHFQQWPFVDSVTGPWKKGPTPWNSDDTPGQVLCEDTLLQVCLAPRWRSGVQPRHRNGWSTTKFRMLYIIYQYMSGKFG